MIVSDEYKRRWWREDKSPPALMVKGVFILLFVCVSLFGSYIFVSDLWVTHRSKAWTRTTGIITESCLRRAGRSGSRAKIEYTYVVAGRDYKGDRILPGNNRYYRDAAKINQYTIGTAVSVFYDPATVKDSCLETGVVTASPFLMLFIAGGSAFSLFGCIKLMTSRGSQP